MIMSLLAVVSVAGLVFAFNNANRNQDIYANITTTIDNDNLQLEIEVEEDPETGDLRLVDNDASVAYFTITVSGLPDYLNKGNAKGVAFNNKIEGGIADITLVSFNATTGESRFRVTGLNGGHTRVVFTTISGGREIYVNIKVVLKAKYVNLAKKAHFGVMQGGVLNFNSSDAYAKLAFYAHEKDVNQFYKPTDFSQLNFELAGTYPGVSLENGILRTTDAAQTGGEIYALVSLPEMTKPVAIPVYVFAPMSTITVETTAFMPETTEAEYYDLILNRTSKDSAVFNFAVPDYGTVGVDYGFEVRSAEASLVSVEKSGESGGARKLMASRNLGETTITITAYPIAMMTVDGVANQRVEFKDAIDGNVQMTRTINVRVRNEFITQSEQGKDIMLPGKMIFSKQVLNAFYYRGVQNNYFDNFTINTANGVSINYDNYLNFELIVEDANPNKKYAGVINQFGYFNEDGITLKSGLGGYTINDILDLRVLGDNNQWQEISAMNNVAHYRSQFGVALTTRWEIIETLLSSNITLKLRAKSVAKLSTSTEEVAEYAISDVALVGCMAIDDFAFQQNGREVDEIALVYNQGSPSNPVVVDVYGIVQNAKTPDWDVDKVVFNNQELTAYGIGIKADPNHTAGKITFTLTIDATDFVYYQAYPFTLTYPNGVTRTVNVKVYPYVSKLNMSMVSDNDGVVYKTVMDPAHPEYLQTVFVRMGATYRINVDTPEVSVGAQTDLYYEAKKEGHESIQVRLSAYNDDVFLDRQLTFTVNIVVVNPVYNVTFRPANNLDTVVLSGIGQSEHIYVDVSLMQEMADRYSNLYIEQVSIDANDQNVEVSDLSSLANGFDITAKYLTTEAITLGFRVYKRYEIDFDGDRVIDEVLELPFIGGKPTKIVIEPIKGSNLVQRIEAIEDRKVVKTADGLGKYLSVIADNTEKTFNFVLPNTGAKDVVGLAFAKWQDGKFDLDYNLQINEIVRATLNGMTVTLNTNPNVKSMGEYAIVLYAKDSMRLVNDVATPDVSLVLPLYIGTSDQIENTIDNITSGEHDANSGVLNRFGGYNWVVGGNSNTAILFYTEPVAEEDEITSAIRGNRYYLDDLYTVLGWPELIDTDPADDMLFTLELWVGGAKQKNVDMGILNSRRRYFEIDEVNRAGQPQVKYILRSTSQSTVSRELTFYPVEGIKRFDVKITNETGLAASKTLLPDGTKTDNEMEQEFEKTVRIQRGKPIEFYFDTHTDYQWSIDAPQIGNTDALSYSGGTYQFTPYIEFDGLRFTVTGLTATVRVEIYGGVDYLNISQRSTTVNGAVGAIYDVTVKIDRPWDVSLLNYWFVYNGVSYPLFTDLAVEHIATYIPMEGGSAGFYWQLTCLNPTASRENYYYTYYLRIDVSVIIDATALNPFRDIKNAQLVVQENLSGSALKKEPAEKRAYLNVQTETVSSVTLKHFANTIFDRETGDLSVPVNQTDTTNIYIDTNIAGGVLKVYPTPYYISVDSIELACTQPYIDDKNVIGKDLYGRDIYDEVKYSIGFTQLVYNQDTNTYQTFMSGNSYRMVSSWSSKNGYQWDGVYYFKTFLKYDGNPTKSLPEDADVKFPISVTIKSDGKTIIGSMILYPRYKDGITVTPGTGNGSVAVNTMSQTRYQAIGTTAVYDITFPSDYFANYNAYTVHGNGAAYVDVTVDAVSKTKTVRVALAGNQYAINSYIEIRFPYKAKGDFANPYLSVIIVPVFFEVTGFDFYDHPENPLQILDSTSIYDLRVRAITKYNANLNLDMNAMVADFNGSLRTSSVVKRYSDDVNLTINVTYSYVNGLPVLTENGAIMREQVFKYTNEQSAPLTRTVNQAIGLTKEYNLDIPDKVNLLSDVKLVSQKNNNNLGDVELSSNGKITVSLNYNTKLIETNDVLLVNIYSRFNRQTPVFTLKIVPVYFTFDGFKLKNYPVDPLIALSKSFVVELEAANVEYYQGTVDAANAIATRLSAFDQALTDAENVRFTRVAGDALNFNFNSYTREITRIGDITANSYLKVSANIEYANGVPTLVSAGSVVTTVFTVKTYGTNGGDSGADDGTTTPTAPSTRTMYVAQAIGLTRSYNIALANVNYDSSIDKNEIIGGRAQAWTSSSQWDAVLRGNTVEVTLAADPNLFDMILQIAVYSQEDSITPAYIINVSPAWFTVESIQIVGHPERPLWIITSEESIDNLQLDFVAAYDSRFDVQSKMDDFRKKLNDSLSVLRRTNDGVLSIMLGLTFNNGQPTISTVNNPEAVMVRSDFAYKLFDEKPDQLLFRTQAQVIGEEVTYTVDLGNKTITSIKATQYNELLDTWTEINTTSGWSVATDSTDRTKINVKLNADPKLIGKDLRVEFYTDTTAEPDFVLYIVPAYFVVEDLAVDGQTGRDIWIITPDTPQNVALVGVTRGDINTHLTALTNFNADLQSAKVTRAYEADSLSGDLQVAAYVQYQSGVPVVVSAPAAGVDDHLIINFTTTFAYTIYAAGDYNPRYPDLPTTPRTRTEVQAIGTTARYKIDLAKDVAKFSDNILQNDDYEAHWEGDEVVVTIKKTYINGDLDIEHGDKTFSLNLYSVFDTTNQQTGLSKPIFVLTIKPVLFEVKGFAVVGHPETPISLSPTQNLNALQYRAVAKYDHSLESKVKGYLDSFNQNLQGQINTNNTRYVQITTDSQYLTIAAGINYINPTEPTFCPISENPTKVVETTFAYRANGVNGNTANLVQAIGTTEYYTLDNLNGSGYTVNQGEGVKEAKFENGVLAVTLNDSFDFSTNTTVKVQIQSGSTTVFTLNITPVWFVVEGFEVLYHPERPLWLIVPEKIADLKFSAKAKYNPAVAGVAAELAAFNNSLQQNEYNQFIMRLTSGGEYLTASAAIEYQKGLPVVVDAAKSALTNVVKSTFQYKMYNNSGNNITTDDDLIYPNVPKSLTKAQPIGLTKEYHVDLPDLTTYGMANAYIVEEAADGTQTRWTNFANDGWDVSMANNRITVRLSTNQNLLNKVLRIYIYYTRDNPNPAFILNIVPVWFTVTDIAVVDHPEQPFIVAENELTEFISEMQFMAVAEYASELAETVAEKITEFNSTLSGNVDKPRTGPFDGVYYLTASAQITYQQYQGTATISDNFADRIARTFAIKIAAKPEKQQKTVVQAIGTTQTYTIDIDDEITVPETVSGYAVSINGDEVTVSLPVGESLIGKNITITLSDSFDLVITPVWFVVEGFEVVEHPERPMWLFFNNSTADLVYRARTNAIPSGLQIEIGQKIDAFNASLAEQRNTLLSEMLYGDNYLIVRAAIEYQNGLPVLVAMINDLCNVVEEVIEYRVWADSKRPTPQNPPVMGTSGVLNQVIGDSKGKSYSLSNINGKIYYQYLWVEGAGSVKSGNSLVKEYESATLTYDAKKNKINVQLAADTNLRGRLIKIYLPYLVTVNGADIWYSYCLEIRPVLFEVYGLGLTVKNMPNTNHQFTPSGNYIHLQGAKDSLYLAELNGCFNYGDFLDADYSEIEDKDLREKLQALQAEIKAAMRNFNTALNNNPHLVSYPFHGDNIYFYLNGNDQFILQQRTTEQGNSSIYLSTMVDYTTGIPQIVAQGGVTVTAEVKVYTGADIKFPPDEVANLGSVTHLQVLGTTVVYDVNIPGIDNEAIDYENLTFSAIEVEGIDDYVKVTYDDEDATISVSLDPYFGLLYAENIRVDIPFTVQDNTYYYTYYIKPILFRVDGFSLVGYPSNNVNLGLNDVVVELELQVTRSTSASIRNQINLVINNLENQINNSIRNNELIWEIVRPGATLDPNMQLVFQGGELLLRRFGNATAVGRLVTELTVGYEAGLPVLAAGASQTTIPIQIVVNTVEQTSAFFPGMDNITMGDNSFATYQQAIGTSKTYNIRTSNTNQVFYLDYLVARNAGPLRGANQYEYVDIQWSGDNNSGEISVSLKADVSLLTDTIEIRIPYTDVIDGNMAWRYYSLSIEPALFEIVGWGIKQGDSIVNQITLGAYAQEIKFAAKIVSAPLVRGANQVFTDEDLRFIESAIEYVNDQLNQYEVTLNNSYRYLFIHDTPQEGSSVNYLIYRDAEAQTNYIVRDIAEVSRTIMQVSAKVSYQIDGNRVIGASHPTIGSGQMVYDTIAVTTNNAVASNETVITQDNAYLLAQLSANTDYIIMSDIRLSQVFESGWTPAEVPANTTLDGNNYRIFMDTNFNLNGNPNNIGLFSTVASGAVLKNIQVVLPAQDSENMNYAHTLEVSLSGYQSGTINVGLLAGTNNGIITNCAVLSEWQFKQFTRSIINPITNEYFTENLSFNADGYLFDNNYYYLTDYVDGALKVVKVYDSTGVRLVENSKHNWVQDLDQYGNVRERVTLLDKTVVANYDNHSALMGNGHSTAKLFVVDTNSKLEVVLGGLVGTNSHMITNSRVLIDVALDGPQTTTVAVESAKSAMVGGFLGTNTGTITTSFFRDGNVINDAYVGPANSGVVCYLGGFVGYNQAAGIIMQSYAMGKSTERAKNINFTSMMGSVKTIRNGMGGFVHQNAGTITDCLVNMVIDLLGEDKAGGFVYQNTRTGTITNAIENNFVMPMSGGTYDFYKVFFVMNNTMTTANSDVSSDNLFNIFYANNRPFSHKIDKLERLDGAKFTDLKNYSAFSIGQGDESTDVAVSAKNTIWQMTALGPKLRGANDIAISYRKYKYADAVYLFDPGTARNPDLIWNQDLFREYVYNQTPTATEADENKTDQNVEINRQGNHLRMVDNITLDTIPDTYKITYTGTLEGNGLTMSGINLPAFSGKYSTIGLFGKLEYATIRNIHFTVSSVGIEASGMRYVGGLAGISINTNYVDVEMNGASAATVMGANIVGGVAGLAVITNSNVENYNVTSNVSVKAARNDGYEAPGDALFSSGIGYYQQTLYAMGNNYIEQGYSTAGGVFGFVTSNPNNYRINYGNDTYEVVARAYEGNQNQDKAMFLKDAEGNVINDTGLYNTEPIVMRQVGGAVKNVTGAVVGGLIGVMDETIELRDSRLTGLGSLVGKYYLGGLVGINLGMISGGSVNISSFNVKTVLTDNTSSRNKYIFCSVDSEDGRYWGMTVGAVAAYNDGLPNNSKSGLIQNLNVNVNMLSSSDAKYIYVIGGVVGVNGELGYVDNVVNQNYSSGKNIILGDTSKIGYYFGNIVGRGNIGVDYVSDGSTQSFSSYENTTMDLVRVPFRYAFVSATDFATPNNAFGVEVANGVSYTNKVQTLTMQEYKTYLLDTIMYSPIPERVTALEYWYRSLPTEIVPDYVNNQYVAVEAVKEEYLESFLKWIDDNDVFYYLYGGIDYEDAFLKDYREYVAYAAIGTNVTWLSQKANLEASRQERADMAAEFFTYKVQITGNNAGVQNLKFTWSQYEDYCYVRKNSTTTDTKTEKSKDEVINWAHPIQEFVKYSIADPESNVGTSEYISNNGAMLDLVAAIKNNDKIKFTENDPLQGYINYLIEYSKNGTNHYAKFERGNGWTMSLPQYYYFVLNILPNSYGLTKTKYQYTAEEYADYLYTNNNMLTNKISLDAYIDFARNEKNKVMQYETEWVREGHIINGTRVSKEAGGVTMGWNDWNWGKWDENVKVDNDGTVVYYEVDGVRKHTWQAFENYFDARENKGLDIASYEEIRRLGGSLWELCNNYANTELYLFALKFKQYSWTDEQHEFIRDDTLYGAQNIKYAIAATYTGNVLSYQIENARSVDPSRDNTFKGSTWFIDSNNDGVYTSGERTGDYELSNGTTYTMNGKEYRALRNIVLRENGSQGPALYLDNNGDKLFRHQDDTLVLYALPNETGADFSQQDSTTGKITYYAISRYIKENNSTVMNYGDYEKTKNHSDYLEEALWWLQQGFSAEEFDRIKFHTMQNLVMPNGTNSPQVKLTFDKDTERYLPVTREMGFTIADDWSYVGYDDNGTITKTTGFKDEANGLFATADYASIVTGTKFSNLANWKSKYAEYKMFEVMIDPNVNANKLELKNFTQYMPDNSATNIANPFGAGKSAADLIDSLVPESVLAQAIGFSNNKEAYLTLATAGGTLVDYVAWAMDENNRITDTYYKELHQKLGKKYYLTLNQYIYWVSYNLADKNTSLLDFAYALTELNVRDQIWYSGVTPQAKTTDLLTFRQEWWNNGNPFMTFRDYCEWLNIYAYGEDFRIARGEMVDGEEAQAESAWLNIYAYAVWKRMEKYSNNVVYAEKAGTGKGITDIIAPIYRRQISTTVFPKVYSSGNAAYIGDNPRLPSNMLSLRDEDDDNVYSEDFVATYFGWPNAKSNPDPMTDDSGSVWSIDRFAGRERHWLDRYEYNEQYKLITMDKNFVEDYVLLTSRKEKGAQRSVITDESLANYYPLFMPETLYSQACDGTCGGVAWPGWDGEYVEWQVKAARRVLWFVKEEAEYIYQPDIGNNEGVCTNPNHAKYQLQVWEKYGYIYQDPEGIFKEIEIWYDGWSQSVTTKEYYTTKNLVLDEVPYINDEDEEYVGITNQYAQLYVPYDVFEMACRKIKAYYSGKDDYKGYENYMHYWAKNGSPYWISGNGVVPNEYPVRITAQHDPFQWVIHPYSETYFWNNFNPQGGTSQANPVGGYDDVINW